MWSMCSFQNAKWCQIFLLVCFGKSTTRRNHTVGVLVSAVRFQVWNVCVVWFLRSLGIWYTTLFFFRRYDLTMSMEWNQPSTGIGILTSLIEPVGFAEDAQIMVRAALIPLPKRRFLAKCDTYLERDCNFCLGCDFAIENFNEACVLFRLRALEFSVLLQHNHRAFPGLPTRLRYTIFLLLGQTYPNFFENTTKPMILLHESPFLSTKERSRSWFGLPGQICAELCSASYLQTGTMYSHLYRLLCDAEMMWYLYIVPALFFSQPFVQIWEWLFHFTDSPFVWFVRISVHGTNNQYSNIRRR